MMRLESMSRQPVPENPQADVAGFLRVELHGGDVAALDRGGERRAVVGDAPPSRRWPAPRTSA